MLRQARAFSIVASLMLCLAVLSLFLSIDVQAVEPLRVALPMLFNDCPLLQLSGQVVFVSNRDGDPEIYRMDTNGENLLQLTLNTVRDSSPDWSPDGNRIAFSSDRNADVDDIFIMDADGSNVVPLPTVSRCYDPKWSQDGLRIAYYCNTLDGDVIYTIEPDGENPVTVSQPQNDVQDLTWSPDSTQIAFSTYFEAIPGVYLIDSAGGEAVLLFERQYVNGLAWSPDGRWLALNSMVEPSFTHDLFLYDLDSDELIRLTETTTIHFSPEWYPLGQYLIFQGFLADGMTSYIYTITQTGTQLQQLTTAGSDYAPDWIP